MSKFSSIGDEWVRIIGFGSLLSEKSARRSFPDMKEFRTVLIPGAKRVFGHAAPVFFERGIATAGPPYEFASLCVEPWPATHSSFDGQPPPCSRDDQFSYAGKSEAALQAIKEGRYIASTSFYVPPESLSELVRREFEFSFVNVQPFSHTVPHIPDGPPAVMCCRGSDELTRARLRDVVCGMQPGQGHATGGERLAAAVLSQSADDDERKAWHDWVVRHGIDTLWHHPVEKILPCRPYLRLCVLAAEVLQIKDNFLDSTFLADRLTPVRIHLLRNPELMDTEPPKAVRHFYSL